MKTKTKIMISVITVILVVLTSSLFIAKSIAEDQPDCISSAISPPGVYNC